MRPPLPTIDSKNSLESGCSLSTSNRTEHLSSTTVEDVARKTTKPKIRTITAFIKLTEFDFLEKSDYTLSMFPSLKAKIDAVVDGLKDLEIKYQEDGYIVESLRIATNPFGVWLLQNDEFVLADRLEFLGSLLHRHGIFGCCLGPAKNTNELACVRQIIASSEKFHCFFMLKANDHVGAHEAKEMVYDISSLNSQGLANFRFAVAAKTCKPWNPCFPVAYYEEEEKQEEEASTGEEIDHRRFDVRFAIGLENSSIVKLLLRKCGTIENIDTIFRQGMVEALIPIQQIATNFCSTDDTQSKKNGKHGNTIRDLDKIFRDVMVHVLFPPGIAHSCSNHIHNGVQPISFRFMGIDTTVHFPFKTSSFVSALECLDEIDEFGECGTIAACTAISKVLQSMECIRSTGFCGLDIPVCSDRRFVQLIESSICPRRLINILPVCANGIDMVCVPGSDVHLHTQSEQSLRSLLLDMVTLAEQLGKPLISRILPVPGKKKGDRVNFGSSSHFINCNVIYLDKGECKGER